MLYAAAHLIRPPKGGHLPLIGEGNVPIPDTCLGNKVEYTKNTHLTKGSTLTMSKRKILTLAMALSMIAILAVGATIAYFTDTDSKTNTFTIGDVEIQLNEVFPNNKLFPGEENALQKVVTVENKGSEDAYMWIELWIPAALDTRGDAAQNDLHINPFDTYVDENGNEVLMRGTEAQKRGYTKKYETVETELASKEINGVLYNGYREHIKNDTPKKTGESTAALLARVFMDKDIKQCTNSTHDKNCLVLKDGTHYTGTWELIVNAYGIQAAGIENIEAAIAAYDGE